MINLIFFSFAIKSYILHGALKDTTNQFKVPHQMGKWHLPQWMMSFAMLLLALGEVLATGILVFGVVLKFY